MQKPTSDSGRRRRPSTRFGCGCCASVPVVLVAASWLLFVYHNRPPDIAIPTPVLPKVNAYDDFVRAGQMAGQMVHKSPYDMMGTSAQNETFANYAACAKDAVPVMALLRKALKEPYLCRPVRSFRDTSFEDYAEWRELERTVAGEAGFHALSGHPGRAADSMLDGLEMGVTLERGGNVMVFLVGSACQAIATSRFEPLLPRLSQAELAHVAARLDTIAERRVTYSDVLLEQCYTDVAELREMFRDPKMRHDNQVSLLKAISGEADESGSRPTWKERSQALASLLADKNALLRREWTYYHALADEARRPYTGTSNVPLPADMQYSDLIRNLAIQGRRKFCKSEAVIALLRAEVALYRYRYAHGRYPDTLAELVPAYLSAVPTDPFGQGKPLRYTCKVAGNSFLLYSLGPNLTDEGGQPGWNLGEQGGDIVAGSLWPRRPVVPGLSPDGRRATSRQLPH